MAQAKLSKSGKQVQFVEDDHGVVYGFSVSQLLALLQGRVKGDMVRGSRLPFPVSLDRFEPSDVWDNNTGDMLSLSEARERHIPSAVACEQGNDLDFNNDALSKQGLKEREDERKYSGGEISLG